MADNDGDGVRGEAEDGVDPNRNFATNWGLDNEGSSDDPTTETFRGTGPASEPETKAMHGAVGPGRLRLPEERPHGVRAAAVSARLPAVHDDARQRDLRGAGRQRRRLGDRRQACGTTGESETWDIQDSPLDEDTSVNRFDPDLGAELYITNGDTLEDAYTQRHPRLHARGLRAGRPERLRLRVPGRRGRHRGRVPAPPAVLARPRAARPRLRATRPRTSATACEDFYVDDFAVSYGDPQTVEVTAKRSLGDVRLRYRDQRRRGPAGLDQGGAQAASASATRRASSTSACAAR